MALADADGPGAAVIYPGRRCPLVGLGLDQPTFATPGLSFPGGRLHRSRLIPALRVVAPGANGIAGTRAQTNEPGAAQGLRWLMSQETSERDRPPHAQRRFHWPISLWEALFLFAFVA